MQSKAGTAEHMAAELTFFSVQIAELCTAIATLSLGFEPTGKPERVLDVPYQNDFAIPCHGHD